ncbi:MAG TPA: hypothetical protein VGX94_12665 [Terriglobia bacterium]|nr:hypothetical protein [Terriglobia bacterium]
MFVRLSATGRVVDMPQAQAGAMLAAGDADIPGKPNAHRDAAIASRAHRKTDADRRAQKSILAMIVGELVQLAGVLAVIAGLALGWRDLWLDIPIACGLIAFYIGRRMRRWGNVTRPAPHP